jgi:hypothetical protein
MWGAGGVRRSNSEEMRRRTIMGIFSKKHRNKSELLNRLLELMGTEKKFLKTLSNLGNKPDETGWYNESLEKVGKERIGELMELLKEVYNKALSTKEVKELVLFYESSVGRKLIETNHSIEPVLVNITDAWIRSINLEVMRNAEREMLNRAAEKGINARNYIPPINTTF